MLQPHAVIFDMDGVLFDTESIYLNSFIKAAEPYGLQNIRETALDFIGKSNENPGERLKSIYGNDFPVDAFLESAKRLTQEQLKNGYPIKPGAIELLHALTDHQIPLALASSTSTKMVIKALMRAELIHYFRHLVGGDMVQNSKPHPDIFLTAAALLRTAPQDCLVLEDSPAGVTAACSAGMSVIMISDLIMPDDTLKAKAAAVVSTLDQVIPLLKLTPVSS